MPFQDSPGGGLLRHDDDGAGGVIAGAAIIVLGATGLHPAVGDGKIEARETVGGRGLAGLAFGRRNGIVGR